MGVYPNGDTLDLIRQLTETLLGTPGGLDLDIDQTLLTSLLGGSLPCLQLTNLFAGDPNGTWTFIVNNIGTGPLTFNVPDFDVIVSADSCAALNGVDQIVTVPGSSATIPPDSSYVSISFRIPPLPASFPSINQSCVGFGTPVQVYVAGATEVCEPNSVKEFSNLASFNLIPNPATNMVVVNGSMKNSNQIAITVTDVLGKTLIKEHAYSNIKQFNHQLNIADLASGVYMVRIASNNEYKTLRLVKE
jgi:archaellum component FlaG (FlaF/FlaG flagellin family)